MSPVEKSETEVAEKKIEIQESITVQQTVVDYDTEAMSPIQETKKSEISEVSEDTKESVFVEEVAAFQETREMSSVEKSESEIAEKKIEVQESISVQETVADYDTKAMSPVQETKQSAMAGVTEFAKESVSVEEVSPVQETKEMSSIEKSETEIAEKNIETQESITVQETVADYDIKAMSPVQETKQSAIAEVSGDTKESVFVEEVSPVQETRELKYETEVAFETETAGIKIESKSNEVAATQAIQPSEAVSEIPIVVESPEGDRAVISSTDDSIVAATIEIAETSEATEELEATVTSKVSTEIVDVHEEVATVKDAEVLQDTFVETKVEETVISEKVIVKEESVAEVTSTTMKLVEVKEVKDHEEKTSVKIIEGEDDGQSDEDEKAETDSQEDVKKVQFAGVEEIIDQTTEKAQVEDTLKKEVVLEEKQVEQQITSSNIDELEPYMPFKALDKSAEDWDSMKAEPSEPSPPSSPGTAEELIREFEEEVKDYVAAGMEEPVEDEKSESKIVHGLAGALGVLDKGIDEQTVSELVEEVQVEPEEDILTKDASKLMEVVTQETQQLVEELRIEPPSTSPSVAIEPQLEPISEATESKESTEETVADEKVIEDFKKQDVDELFVVMMPPGDSSFDVKDHDEAYFDELNAPRHSDADEQSEAQLAVLGKTKQLKTEASTEMTESIETSTITQKTESLENLSEPALKMHGLHKLTFDWEVAEKTISEAETIAEEVKITEDTSKTPKVLETSAPVLQKSETVDSDAELKVTIEEEQDQESGFEVSTNRSQVKSSLDDGSTVGEQSLDLLQSDKTDSLFQSNEMNDSAQTLSEHTMEAELPSDYDTVADTTVNAPDEITLQLEEGEDKSEEVTEEEIKPDSTKLKDSVTVTQFSPSKVASPHKIDETVEIIPSLNWDLKDKDEECIPSKSKEDLVVDVKGLTREQIPSTSESGSTSTDGRATSSSQEGSSVPSSRMSERSGTQSSIEYCRSSSRSSHPVTESSCTRSSRSPPSVGLDIEEENIALQQSLSPYSSHATDGQESARSISSKTSCDTESKSKKQVVVSDSAKEYSADESKDSKSPTAQLKSSGEISPHSLPSSPRRLRRTTSNGVKKLVTSEMFSTDNDLSRSLEIVYSEPTSDERRKLSDRYRHTSSSSGASNGSVNAEQSKMEKRKASFTPIRKSSEEGDRGLEPIGSTEGQESDSPYATTGYTTSTSEDMKLQHTTPVSGATSEVKEDSAEKSPIKEKKIATPTKIMAPTKAQDDVQVSSDVISPMLDVECSTPERKTPHKSRG